MLFEIEKQLLLFIFFVQSIRKILIHVNLYFIKSHFAVIILFQFLFYLCLFYITGRSKIEFNPLMLLKSNGPGRSGWDPSPINGGNLIGHTGEFFLFLIIVFFVKLLLLLSFVTSKQKKFKEIFILMSYHIAYYSVNFLYSAHSALT